MSPQSFQPTAVKVQSQSINPTMLSQLVNPLLLHIYCRNVWSDIRTNSPQFRKFSMCSYSIFRRHKEEIISSLKKPMLFFHVNLISDHYARLPQTNVTKISKPCFRRFFPYASHHLETNKY